MMIKLLPGAEFEISAEIKDHNAIVRKAQTKESSDSVCCFEVLNESGACIASIKAEVQTSGNSACLVISGEMARGADYDIRKTFAAFESIKLYLKPKNKADKVTGNYYCIMEKSDCWAKAFFADDITEVPKRIASMLWQQGDVYYSMLPLCSGDFKGEIHGNGSELEITVAPYTGGYRKIYAKTIVITLDSSPYDAIEKNIEAGFSFLGLRRAMRKDAKLPEIFNYLGWCSWDSCRLDVSDEKVYKKMEEFKEKGVPVKWVLVDDGWFKEKDGRMLWDFEVDKKKFPNGIRSFISELKNKYNIKEVGFWQCFSGNWRGIHPESPIVKDHPELVFKTNYGEVIPSPTASGSFDFWNTWDSYLANEGVDFLKVDVQTNVEACTHNNIAIGRAAKGAYYGMEAAAALHFNGAVINCTAMGHECLWNKPQNVINRNSGDFVFDDVNTMRDFSVDNVYNSMYHSHFCHTDWDMLQTHGETAVINTVLHAVSGAPVYLSDLFNETEASVANAFADSEGRLYKCDDFAMPVYERIFTDPEKEKVLLKFQNHAAESGLIGAVNVNKNNEEITDIISARDITKISGDEFILFSYFENSFEKLTKNENKEITLSPLAAAIYQFTPIMNGFAFIGFTDKYVSAAAVSEKIELDNKIILRFRDGGIFTYYSEKEHEVYVNGKRAESRKNGLVFNIEIEKSNDIILEIIIK